MPGVHPEIDPLLYQGSALMVLLTLVEAAINRSHPEWLARLAYVPLAEREIAASPETQSALSESSPSANYRTSALGGLDLARLSSVTGRTFTARNDCATTALGVPIDWGPSNSSFGGAVRIDLLAGAGGYRLRARAAPSPLIAMLPSMVLVVLIARAYGLPIVAGVALMIGAHFYTRAQARRTLTPHANSAMAEIAACLESQPRT